MWLQEHRKSELLFPAWLALRGDTGSGVPATKPGVLQARLQLFFPPFKGAIAVTLHCSFYRLRSWLQAPSGQLKMGPPR